MIQIIGLGEYAVCKNTEDSIKTFALASCVGLVLYDPIKKILGMAHIVYPTRRDKEDIEKEACFFADKAVPLLFQKVFGGFPDNKIPYQVSLFGGAESRMKQDIFCMGPRNVQAIEEILQEHNIWYEKKNTGGIYSRTICATVKDGRVSVRAQKMTI